MLNADYWSNRYQSNEIGWDIGEVSTPLKAYFDQLKDKSIRILIPGCGNAYEAKYLIQNGFTNISVLDFATEPLEKLKNEIGENDHIHFYNEDFFEHQGEYDLIIEQTFFCAINPSERLRYAQKIKELLAPKGKLVGLLFNREFQGGPPFWGDEKEYYSYFEKFFENIKIEPCYNSIKPRLDSEVFIVIS
jgi:SAM-dependent methyltransferase